MEPTGALDHGVAAGIWGGTTEEERRIIATLIGHLIPLFPFVWVSRTPALITAIVLSAGVLFGVGAAAIGFLIGRLFHTAGA